MRAVLEQMSFQIGRIVDVPKADKAAALQEDDIVSQALARAREPAGARRAAGHSDADAEGFMEDMRRGSGAALQRRIAQKELLPSSEFQAALNIRRQSLSETVKSGRMFALMGPSGENFYPARREREFASLHRVSSYDSGEPHFGPSSTNRFDDPARAVARSRGVTAPATWV